MDTIWGRLRRIEVDMDVDGECGDVETGPEREEGRSLEVLCKAGDLSSQHSHSICLDGI